MTERGQLIGYAIGHVLDDDGTCEWFEDDAGHTPAHPTPDAARHARGDADPDTWPVIELRLVPEPGVGNGAADFGVQGENPPTQERPDA